MTGTLLAQLAKLQRFTEAASPVNLKPSYPPKRLNSMLTSSNIEPTSTSSNPTAVLQEQVQTMSGAHRHASSSWHYPIAPHHMALRATRWRMHEWMIHSPLHQLPQQNR